MLYDITRTISTRTQVWPGDAPYSAAPLLTLAAGHAVNLTTLTMSAHTGTHADAYYHYVAEGQHPAGMLLDAYIGRALVVTTNRRDGPLQPEDFAHVDLRGKQRLLVRSHVSELDDDCWPETFPYLSVALIEMLASKEFRLVGLDSPSVDAFDSQDLPCHHALWAHHMVNLEHLYLRDVPDGEYELIALPLKLDAACGSPVRAVLRPLDR